MTETIVTSIIAYIGTNIDDIIILMLLFAQPNVNFSRILFGKWIGIGILTAISLFGAFGIGLILPEYIRILGVIPILLGFKAFFSYRKDQDESPTEEKKNVAIWNVAAITIANGADNLGIYIPLFTGYSFLQILIAVAIFAVMTFLWCILGSKISKLSPIQKLMRKYSRIAVPVIYIALGIYILLF
jgi:cadmium resistance protein CadD (predicted permease)